MEIKIDHHPAQDKLQELGVFAWPIWEKEASEFPWSYDSTETCYILEGRVVVTPQGQAPVKMGAGDLVIFPAGMACTWKVLQKIRKHYSFS